MTPEQSDFLLSIDKEGTIAPEEVVAAAAPPTSPIHDLFEWDDSKAAHAHRLSQARKVITDFEFIVTTTTRILECPMYTRDPRLPAGQSGYVRVAALRTLDDSRRASLQSEVDRVRSFIHRTRAMAAGMGLEDEAELMLQELLGIRQPVRP